MKTEAELHTEFYEWLDEELPPVRLSHFNPELNIFIREPEDHLSDVRRAIAKGIGGDCYVDVLYSTWLRHFYGDENIKINA